MGWWSKRGSGVHTGMQLRWERLHRAPDPAPVCEDAVDDGLVQQWLRPAEGPRGRVRSCPAVGIEAAGQRADLPGQRPDLFPLRLAVQQGSLCRGRGLRGQKHTEVLQSLADAVHRDQVSLGWTEQVRERVGERLRRTERTRAVRQEVRGAAGGSGTVGRGAEEER